MKLVAGTELPNRGKCVHYRKSEYFDLFLIYSLLRSMHAKPVYAFNVWSGGVCG